MKKVEEWWRGGGRGGGGGGGERNARRESLCLGGVVWGYLTPIVLNFSKHVTFHMSGIPVVTDAGIIVPVHDCSYKAKQWHIYTCVVEPL